MRWRDYTTYAKPRMVSNEIPKVAKGDDEIIINTATNNKSCLLNEQGNTTTAMTLCFWGLQAHVSSVEGFYFIVHILEHEWANKV